MSKQQVIQWLVGAIVVSGTVFLLPILIWIGIRFLPWTTEPLRFPATLAEFGDSYGVANAIVSGLAFAAIVVSLILQRNDLATNQKHLEASLQEMAQTSESTKELAQSQRQSNELAAFDQWRALSEILSSRNCEEEKLAPHQPHLTVRWYQDQLALLRDCRRMRIESGRKLPDDIEKVARRMEYHMGELLWLWGSLENSLIDKEEIDADEWRHIQNCVDAIETTASRGRRLSGRSIKPDNLDDVAFGQVRKCSTWLRTICQQGQCPNWPDERPKGSPLIT